jgi:hypothetical protein
MFSPTTGQAPPGRLPPSAYYQPPPTTRTVSCVIYGAWQDGLTEGKVAMSKQTSKTAIVTGAASGIGFACVEGLLAESYSVCGVDVQAIPVERLKSDKSRFLSVRASVATRPSVRMLWRKL